MDNELSEATMVALQLNPSTAVQQGSEEQTHLSGHFDQLQDDGDLHKVDGGINGKEVIAMGSTNREPEALVNSQPPHKSDFLHETPSPGADGTPVVSLPQHGHNTATVHPLPQPLVASPNVNGENKSWEARRKIMRSLGYFIAAISASMIVNPMGNVDGLHHWQLILQQVCACVSFVSSLGVLLHSYLDEKRNPIFTKRILTCEMVSLGVIAILPIIICITISVVTNIKTTSISLLIFYVCVAVIVISSVTADIRKVKKVDIESQISSAANAYSWITIEQTISLCFWIAAIAFTYLWIAADRGESCEVLHNWCPILQQGCAFVALSCSVGILIYLYVENPVPSGTVSSNVMPRLVSIAILASLLLIIIGGVNNIKPEGKEWVGFAAFVVGIPILVVAAVWKTT